MEFCCNCSNFLTFAKSFNVTKLLTNLVAFMPPSKVKYQIREDLNPRNKEDYYNKVKFIHEDFCNISFPWIKAESYLLRKGKNNRRIVLLHIINTSIKGIKPTYIFSHGNACDLGEISPFLVDLSTQLKVSPSIKIREM